MLLLLGPALGSLDGLDICTRPDLAVRPAPLSSISLSSELCPSLSIVRSSCTGSDAWTPLAVSLRCFLVFCLTLPLITSPLTCGLSLRERSVSFFAIALWPALAASVLALSPPIFGGAVNGGTFCSCWLRPSFSTATSVLTGCDRMCEIDGRSSESSVKSESKAPRIRASTGEG